MDQSADPPDAAELALGCKRHSLDIRRSNRARARALCNVFSQHAVVNRGAGLRAEKLR